MRSPDTTNWIRIGLFALPLYGVLTFWSSLDPQPDPNTNYDAWARFVITDHYVLTHVLGSILGLILSIFGTFALGAYLAKSRAGRMGLVAMVITVFGSALFLPGMGVSAFAAPEEGQAYLAGIEGLAELPTSPAVSNRPVASSCLLALPLRRETLEHAGHASFISYLSVKAQCVVIQRHGALVISLLARRVS
jgi:hypothetical protein